MLNSSAATAAIFAKDAGLPARVPRHSRRPRASLLYGACSAAFLLFAAALCLLPKVTACAEAPQDEVQSAPATRASGARLIYTRTLPGSVPEYLSVSVNRDGSGAYEGRGLKEAGHPRPLQLRPEITGKLFALAAELGDFRSISLNSRKKVANLGLKTLTYESGAEKHQVQFNYTEQRTARDLVDLFEGVSNVEAAIDALEYAIKYDPLSLPQELQNIQTAFSQHELVDPELMAASLKRISSNPRFLHVARERADEILNAVGRER